MAILTKQTVNSAHWYTPGGHPAHKQFTRDGSGERPTTIRDARRMKLLPSVTSVLGVFAKPGLDTWKMNQVALAAGRSPRQGEESDAYWLERVKSAAFEQVQDAADLGTRIHDALDHALGGEPYPDELSPYILPVTAWTAQTAIAFTDREKVLVNVAEGYAGRVDALFTYGRRQHGLGILDWKTRKTQPGKPCTPYDGQGMQLAAYAAAAYGPEALPRVLAANVYISTTEPGRMEVCKHEDLPALYEAFLPRLRALAAPEAVRPADPGEPRSHEGHEERGEGVMTPLQFARQECANHQSDR